MKSPLIWVPGREGLVGVNLFLKYIFILFLFFPCDVPAQVKVVRNLLVKTLNGKPTKQNLDELEREIRSFIENIHRDNNMDEYSNVDKFRNESMTKVIGDMADNQSLSDLNFRAAFTALP